jgi:hypothetical protein
MHSRPYNLPKAEIENLYPGHFGIFKQWAATAWRIIQQLAATPFGERFWIENEIQQLVLRLRTGFAFV